MTRWPETQACRKCVPFKCYVEHKKCDGNVGDTADCQGGICPPMTWTNGNYRKIIGESPWRWWVERKIRRSIGPWVEPAYGWKTAFDAYAFSNKVDTKKLIVNGTTLARAFQNFNTLFPDELFPNGIPARVPGQLGRWTLATGVIWYSLKSSGQGPYHFSLRRPDQQGGGNNADPDTTDIAFHLWVPDGTGWLNLPQVQAAWKKLFADLRYKTPEEQNAFVQAAGALVLKVPTAEDDKLVRSSVRLIEFQPGKVIINQWLVEFVKLFGMPKPDPRLKKVAAAVAQAVAKKK